MFQFRRFPAAHYGFMCSRCRSSAAGFPIQRSADHRIFAPTRGLSQLITSFIGSQCQGIHPTLFLFNRFMSASVRTCGRSCSLLLNEFMSARLSACAFLWIQTFVRIHLGCLDILISLECFVLYAVFKVRSGDGEIRTLDPLLARQVLSQLSYTPINSGVHLLSHTVASIVPSAACVLTVVFGMGTSVSHRRIGTGKLPQLSKTRQYGQPLLFSLERR